jgi:hypothetical protein
LQAHGFSRFLTVSSSWHMRHSAGALMSGSSSPPPSSAGSAAVVGARATAATGVLTASDGFSAAPPPFAAVAEPSTSTTTTWSSRAIPVSRHRRLYLPLSRIKLLHETSTAINHQSDLSHGQPEKRYSKASSVAASSQSRRPLPKMGNFEESGRGQKIPHKRSESRHRSHERRGPGTLGTAYLSIFGHLPTTIVRAEPTRHPHDVCRGATRRQQVPAAWRRKGLGRRTGEKRLPPHRDGDRIDRRRRI